MTREERKIVKEVQELESKIRLGLQKEWKARTVTLREAAVGLRLVKVDQDLIDFIVLTWDDGRITVLRANHGESYGNEFTEIEQNEQQSIEFMVRFRILDQKALDYIDSVKKEINRGNKKLERFMLERQLEKYKKELDALDS
jgi:hypothetical protein